MGCSGDQTIHVAKALQAQVGAIDFTHFNRPSIVEPLNDRRTIDVLQVLLEGLSYRGLYQITSNVCRASLFTFVFKLDLSGYRREGRIDVANTRDDLTLAGREAAALRIRDNILYGRDRQPLADAGSLVDALIYASFKRDLFDRAQNEFRHVEVLRVAVKPRFAPGDLNAFFDACRIMG